MNGQLITQSIAFARPRVINTAAMVLLIVACVPGTGVGHALAYDSGTVKTPVAATGQYKVQTAAGGISLSSLYTPSQPVTADQCLPLLKQVRQASDPTPYRNRLPAGQQAVPAVAIGYVLGLRHAPGPKEILKDDISRDSLNDNRPQLEQSHALAISNYRRCRNELELSSLQVR